MDLQKLKGVGPTVADNNKAYLGASGNILGARRPNSGKEPETQQRGNWKNNFHPYPRYNFLHNTKGQSDGSTSVRDIRGNPENPAKNEIMKQLMMRSYMIMGFVVLRK